MSRLDALLAHVWTLVVRARKPELDALGGGEVYMDVTLGLRARLDPPLPDTFVGSPIILAHATLPSSTFIPSPSPLSPLSPSPTTTLIATTAHALRTTLTTFTPAVLASLLHSKLSSRKSSPQRFWAAFLGARHTLVTAWVGAGAYSSVDFGFGPAGGEGGARYVDPLMPGVDGCVCVIEGGPVVPRSREGDRAGKGGKGRGEGRERWYDAPACVSLCLREDVLAKVLSDPALRAYARG